MINFNNCKFKRLIVHHIEAKKPAEDTASPKYESDLFEIHSKVENTIKERLIDAAGMNSKAFELEIEEKGPGSFFELASSLRSSTKANFIKLTQDLTDLLAASQKRSNIPGGKVIIIDAIDTSTNLEIAVVIKAELHEALRQRSNKITLLEDIFLSPSQRLFKIGILYKTEPKKDIYGAIIFDSQFRTDSQPAEYFFKDFLGLAIGANAKLQSKRFFEKTKSFIIEKFDGDDANDLMKALRIEFTINTDKTITPSDFASRYFAEDTKDEYLDQVANELPGSFVKDSELISNSLSKRRLNFPNDIRILGPEEEFEANVKLIKTNSDLKKLDFESLNYSIVKINGKPSIG